MTTPSHTKCPVCAKPVRIVAQPGQRFMRLADHGPSLTALCKGAGLGVTAQQPATPARPDPSRLFSSKP